MLAKCCNPSCDAVFRYLYDGRVFVLENDPAVEPEISRRPEYFWLCQRCSSKMTLRLGEDTPVVEMLLLHEIQERSDSVVRDSPDRKAGLTLRNVVFSGASQPPAQNRALRRLSR
jgi:hypothetical protein